MAPCAVRVREDYPGCAGMIFANEQEEAVGHTGGAQ